MNADTKMTLANAAQLIAGACIVWEEAYPDPDSFDTVIIQGRTDYENFDIKLTTPSEGIRKIEIFDPDDDTDYFDEEDAPRHTVGIFEGDNIYSGIQQAKDFCAGRIGSKLLIKALRDARRR